MASKTYKYVPVDREKFMKIMKQRGIAATELSVELGFNAGYISNQISRGKLSKGTAVYLKTVYNIEDSMYAPDDILMSVTPTTATPGSDIDYEKLFEELKSAVSEGVASGIKEAMSEFKLVDYDELGRVMFESMISALKD